MPTNLPLDSEVHFTTIAAAGLALEVACSKRALLRSASPWDPRTDTSLITMALDLVKLRKVT